MYVSVLGICRTLMPDPEAIDIASALLAQAMITVGDDFGDIPTLLSAARTAPTNSERSLPDLLPDAAAKIFRIYEMTLSSAHAATQLQTLTGRCSDTDTATVRRVILQQH